MKKLLSIIACIMALCTASGCIQTYELLNESIRTEKTSEMRPAYLQIF